MMEGIFICAAPHCLKSFLKGSEFESHIHENHTDLLQPNSEKENGNESEIQSAKQHSNSDSTVQAPSRSVMPGSNSQFLDSEDKARRQQPREQLSRAMMQPRPPFFGQAQNYPADLQPDNSRPPGIQSHFQQSIEGGPQQEANHFSDKQQGILSETSMPEYPPMHPIQPPNFVVPMNSNQMMMAQYGLAPFQPDGAQPFYGAPYEKGQMARPDSTPEVGAEQGSLLGFPPGPAGSANFMENYTQPWNSGPTPGGQAIPDGFPNLSDSRGSIAYYQGDYGRNPVVPMISPTTSSANKVMEAVQAGAMDSRDGKGILAPQPFPYPPPPPPPPPLPHLSQPQRGKYYSGDMGHEGQGFGWQHENRDGFGSGQE
ncbi:hypothetical protein GH714_008621 [Hevea brasiliensis]|nr:hypothetical protein GH714_008621 [Hevea brasiliensis]